MKTLTNTCMTVFRGTLVAIIAVGFTVMPFGSGLVGAPTAEAASANVEVNYDPGGSGTEYIEIQNDSGSEIDLDNVLITQETGSGDENNLHTYPSSQTLADGNSHRVCADQSASSDCDGEWSGGEVLNNSGGDTVTFYEDGSQSSANEIGLVSYTDSDSSPVNGNVDFPEAQTTSGPVENDDTGETFPTIQEALDDASNGDTIEVDPSSGPYNESVTIHDDLDNLTLTSPGSDRAVIEHQTDGKAVLQIDASGVEVSGFEVTGAEGDNEDGQGIDVNGDEGHNTDGVELRDLRVHHNDDRGLVVDYSSGVTIENVQVDHNFDSAGGDDPEDSWEDAGDADGITLWYTDNSQLTNVQATDNGDNGIYAKGNNNSFENITVKNNGDEGLDISSDEGNDGDVDGGATVDGLTAINNNAEAVEIEGNSNEVSITNSTLEGGPVGLFVRDNNSGAVSIEGSNFENNGVQIEDESSQLNMQATLESNNNTFDNAVAIDRPDNSLLHTVWSSIQDAVDVAQNGDTIKLLSDFTTSEQITLDQSVTLEGNGNTIDADFTREDSQNNSAIGVQSDGVTMQNLDLTSSGDGSYPDQLHGINVYESVNVTVDNVSADGFEGSGILVNGSTVNASDITTSNSGWHGINVDQGGAVGQPAVLNISNTSSHDENSPAAPGDFVDGESVPHIFVDRAKGSNSADATVNDIDNQYTSFNVPFRQDSDGENFISDDNEAAVYTLKEEPEGTLGSKEDPYSGNVSICHTSNSGDTWSNPNPNVNALFNQGHDVHEDDIIPPFWYEKNGNNGGVEFYEGKNWDGEGQAFWENGCGVSQCELGEQWADEVTSSDQGLDNGGGSVRNDRSSTSSVLGTPDNNEFFSLGEDGTITVKFDEYILDQDGERSGDISIHEVTDDRQGYVETAEVELSEDGDTWSDPVEVSNQDSNGVSYIDIANTTGADLDYVQYVRLTDTTDFDAYTSDSGDGFDVDAIDGVHGECDEPEGPGQCAPEATLDLDEQANDAEPVTQVSLNDTTVNNSESFDLFASGDTAASQANTNAGEVRVERTPAGFKLYFRGSSSEDVYQFKGSIQLDDVDLTGASISSPISSDAPLEDGSNGGFPDVVNIDKQDSEIDLHLRVGGGNDSFEVKGLENQCEKPDDPTTTIDAPTDVVESCTFTVSGEANADPEIGLNRVYVQLVNRQDNQRYGGTTIDLLGEGESAEWSVEYDADADGLPDGDYAAHVAVVDKEGNKGTAGWTEDFTLDCSDSGGSEPELLTCSADEQEITYIDVSDDNESKIYGLNTNVKQTFEGDYHSVLAADENEVLYGIENTDGDGPANGEPLVTFNSDGAVNEKGDTDLRKPVAMNFAPDGTLYVADQHESEFYTVNPSSGTTSQIAMFNEDKDVDGGDLVIDENNVLTYLHRLGYVFQLDLNGGSWEQLKVENTDHNERLDGNFTSLAYVDGTYYALDKENDEIDRFEIKNIDNTAQDEVVYQDSDDVSEASVDFGDATSCLEEPDEESTGVIEGLKFEDENRNGEQNEGEEGLAEFEILAFGEENLVDTLTIDSGDVEGETTTEMQEGRRYLIEVNGQYQFSNNSDEVADAEYYSRDGFSSVQDFENSNRDPRTLDLVINDQNVDWGAYNEGHLYRVVDNASGDQANFHIFEEQASHYEDNEGSLEVRIYDVTDYSDITGENGNYSIEAPAGEYNVIEVLQPESYVQTFPGDGVHEEVVVTAGETNGHYNFGNDDLADEGEEENPDNDNDRSIGGGGAMDPADSSDDNDSDGSVLGDQDDNEPSGDELNREDLIDMIGSLSGPLSDLLESLDQDDDGTDQPQPDVAGVQDSSGTPGFPNTGDGSLAVPADGSFGK